MLKYKPTPQFVVNTLLISVLAIFLLFYFFKSNKEIVYVDTVKLFDGFVMTKEMKRVGEKEFNSRKLVLDNLYSNLQSPTISASEKKELMQQFIQGKEELEQFNQTFAAEQTTKIWSRIKSYTAEFSKDKNYQLVVGSDNKQAVLFADEKIDITNDLLIYLNKKYEGL
ncbi:OmpH family outer membrane protein [Flavobacterium sp. IMCC34518]|uniref:OmpH family outer membrane protein n=1 Tax=Flavobacterium sp. IMCC34518 TaxID=3003623 RepID=UPI0024828F59|nr:OmpH family outer membrane protein [Flavobacterium sp. IMCC34518]